MPVHRPHDFPSTFAFLQHAIKACHPDTWLSLPLMEGKTYLLSLAMSDSFRKGNIALTISGGKKWVLAEYLSLLEMLFDSLL